MGYFPIDSQTIDYLHQIGRPKAQVDVIQGYLEGVKSP